MAKRPKSLGNPSKPYPPFPLTPHNNGQWCKKVRSRVHLFGVWKDPQAALDNYLRVAGDLHAGRQPASSNIASAQPTVKDVSNHYLSFQLHRLDVREISPRTFEDYRTVTESFARFVGANRAVSDLSPEDFLRFRQKLIRTGLSNTRVTPTRPRSSAICRARFSANFPPRFCRFASEPMAPSSTGKLWSLSRRGTHST